MSVHDNQVLGHRGIFPAEGEMARRIRDADWSECELGPPAAWPEQLRFAVRLCLASKLPMAVWWGAVRRMFCNDGFSRLGLSPSLFEPGIPGASSGIACWEVISDLLDQVQVTGRATAEKEISFAPNPAAPDRPRGIRFALTPVHSSDGSRVEGAIGIVTRTLPDAPDDGQAPPMRIAADSERRRRAMNIESAGIIFFDTAGGITDANDAFLRMAGYARDDVLDGRVNCEAMTPPDCRARWCQFVQEYGTTGRTASYEMQFLRRDGSRWWALISAARIDEDEGVALVLDHTERRMADEELRRHRDELELLAEERTAALDAANGALRDEIVERQRAEASRQELQRKLAIAQEEERRRISRELHDEVGQRITALMLGLKSIESLTDKPAARDTLATLEEIAENLGKQIHDLALELRPTSLDDLGLLRTLSNYIEEWSAVAKIAVELHSSGWAGGRLPAPIETAAYRIVQEALTNVLKHASATRVSLILERRPDQVTIIIEDDGEGFDPDTVTRHPESDCLGLLGMEERAALVNGEVKVESSTGKGTTVFVRIPL